ncbi:hypothetical protein Grass_216 [Bacillus phage Grass]|uniref:Uncharacterized protein n=1 Tax=Bacillus phage Grass TaxID=1406785 RepID=U5PUM7_BPGRA|nr:hypothetical protein Grass_216 [Bacillus phage Grass]AGY47481.1 hypothetical protein Grass_216 [Bacillus phage Grass]
MDISIENQITQKVREYELWRGKLPERVVISRAVKELIEVQQSDQGRLTPLPMIGKLTYNFIYQDGTVLDVVVLDHNGFVILVG